VLRGGQVVILSRESREEVASFAAPNADAVAVSNGAVAFRARKDGRDRIHWRRLRPNGGLGKQRRIAKVGRKGQLSRPSLSGASVAFAVAKQRRNAIKIFRPGKGTRTVIASVRVGLSNPTLRGKHLLYVRHTRKRDELRLRRLGKRSRRLMTSKKRLWSTALSARRAYVTVLEGRAPRARITSRLRLTGVARSRAISE
jgi:hypothetical protein